MSRRSQKRLPVIVATLVASVYVLYSFTVCCGQAHRYNIEWTSCNRELENANRSIQSWSQLMRHLLSESVSPQETAILNEESNIQNLISKFASQLHRKPIEQLVDNLVLIRRKSNSMALLIYLKNYDMRWPQTSVRLGATVERVQQACSANLERAVMLVLRPATVKTRRKQKKASG